MIGNLKKEVPRIWKLIRKELIGGDGTPEPDGSAKGGIVREAEERYNAGKGDYWYRFFKPTDTMITGGTAHTYSATMTGVTEEDILATANPVEVKTAEAIISFGWYCDTDLDQKGYVRALREENVLDVIPARWIWRQKKPDHYWIDLDMIIKEFENTRVYYKIYNGFAGDRTAICIPILFRIAPRATLGLEVPYNR